MPMQARCSFRPKVFNAGSRPRKSRHNKTLRDENQTIQQEASKHYHPFPSHTYTNKNPEKWTTSDNGTLVLSVTSDKLVVRD